MGSSPRGTTSKGKDCRDFWFLSWFWEGVQSLWKTAGVPVRRWVGDVAFVPRNRHSELQRPVPA